jgi:hypothetical protein
VHGIVLERHLIHDHGPRPFVYFDEGSSSHLFAVSVKMLIPDPPASLFRRAAGRKAVPISVGEQLKLLQ